MARADITTWLPLDTWAEILGFHPLHFNQLHHNTLMEGITCGLVWFQHAWLNASRISREDVAQAIREAETQIANEVGYNLLPDWTPKENGSPERLRYERPAVPTIFNANGRNVRGHFLSLTTKKAHIISGGIRKKIGIETVDVDDASGARDDTDGDLYKETVSITIGTTVTDPDELKVYYPGEGGADRWEIRPVEVTIDTDLNQATLTWKLWQMVKPNPQSVLNAETIDAATVTNYLSTVDVYRVWNDPQTQVRFLWEEGNLCTGSCAACQLGTQLGCFHIRDERLGIIAPAYADWSESDQSFTAVCMNACRAPDQAQVYYYSGWQDNGLHQPKTVMDKFWQDAVAYYAASLLSKDGCDCSNAMEFIFQWRTDVSHARRDRGAFAVTQAQLSNRLGTTKGALFAWDRIRQDGRKVAR